MGLSAKAKKVYDQANAAGVKMGDQRKIAKDIKINHPLAMELWAAGGFMPRMLATLIMDVKQLNQLTIDDLDKDIQQHPMDEKLQLIDWLMANQLAKNKQTIALMLAWQHSPSVLQRRTFWYHQARLRWVGQTPPPNTEALLDAIETGMMNEQPEVQWAMNFTAGQIGIFQPQYRQRCIAIGERTGLYKDEVVAKGCTPSYLPQFIPIQVAKTEKVAKG